MHLYGLDGKDRVVGQVSYYIMLPSELCFTVKGLRGLFTHVPDIDNCDVLFQL